MGGIGLLFGFEALGVVMADKLFGRFERTVRLWLGLSLGLLMMMWLPALYAFAIDFTATAQLFGLLTAGVLTGLTVATLPERRRRPRRHREPKVDPKTLLMVLIPFAVLGFVLMHSHYLKEVDGVLYSGQSTYGDMCLHLSIATGLQNAAFPPEYTILPGTTLGYPFLSDTLVTSMLLLGTELSQAFVITGTLMFTLVGWGFFLFCWKLLGRRKATVVAFLLMFLNGGLGFIYAIDMIGVDATAFRDIFTGFYLTPTNQPDLNLRWVNVIADMMVPQRTLLGGWMAVIPAIYLLVDAADRMKYRYFVVLGVWAGTIPLIHTHSFLALGLLSAGVMLYCLLFPKGYGWKKALVGFGLYGGIAVALALPQLVNFAFPQTAQGGVLRLMFNWVNNNAGAGEMLLKDDYLWFWVKNVGLIFLVFVPAALSSSRRGKMLSMGALFIFVIAELVLFQKNVYDNNKLFYIAYMVMVPVAVGYLCDVYNRLKGVKGRAFFAALFLLVSCLSGTLSLAREVVSEYQVFSAEEAEAAEFCEYIGDRDDVFLTGTQHLNAVSALAGRKIVCGPGTYLYYHGLDYGQQDAAVRSMLENPEANADLFAEYGVRYVYISHHERGNYDVDMDYYLQNTKCIYSEGGIFIFDIG